MGSSVDNDTEELVPINERLFKKLVQLGPVHYVQDRIMNLKSINTYCDSFVDILSKPKKLMEGRFEKLELDNHSVQVVTYPTVAKVSEI